MASNALKLLIQKARVVKMSPDDRERQRRSFAYGNANIENDDVTREMVDRQAEALETERDRNAR